MFIFYDLSLGGIQKKIISLAKILSNDNFEHTNFSIVLGVKIDSFLEKKASVLGNVFFRPGLLNYKIKLPFPLYLLIMIFIQQPKVVSTFLQHSSLYVAFVKKIIFFRHFDFIINQDNILSFDLKSKWLKLLIPWVYNSADKVIVQTKFAKLDLIKNFRIKSNKIVVIPNWTLDTKLNNAKKEYDLIYIGRFAPQKDLITMLDVVKKIKKIKPDIVLCLVGEGEDELKLKRYVRKNNLIKNVIFKKTTHDVKKELLKSKIFVLTSKYEGHPLSLLEAMAMKLVPVTIEYPGVNEYLKHKKTGYIEKNKNKMVNRIIRLLKNKDKLKSIGQQAREEVKREYGMLQIKAYLNEVFGIGSHIF